MAVTSVFSRSYQLSKQIVLRKVYLCI